MTGRGRFAAALRAPEGRWKGAPWNDPAPIRAALFGIERLEHHARSLAVAQPVVGGPARRVFGIRRRLRDNAAVLSAAYAATAEAVATGHSITPAAEWLLENFHLVEQQVRQIRDDLPPAYYRQLPKLADGPLAGYPRVVGLAWAYIAHTDSLVSRATLVRFVAAYQEVQPLTIGELWAVAISLRILLVENMRRLAVEVSEGQALRREADALVDLLAGASARPAGEVHRALARYEGSALPEIMAAQMAKRLRGFDRAETPLRVWLDDQLRARGSSPDDILAHAQQRQGATNVSMRNVVTSMRLVSEMDWAEVFEEVSLVDARLSARSVYAEMDFATRNLYRSAIEDIGRGSALTEIQIADLALAAGADDTPARDAAPRDPGHALIGPGRPALERAAGYRPPVRQRIYRMIARPGLAAYISAMLLCAALLLAVGLLSAADAGASAWVLALLASAGLAPAFDAANAVVNLAVTRLVGPRPLPALELTHGIPDSLRTLVVMPVILSDTGDIWRHLERLEVHHLASTGGALHFALLSDGPDAATESAAGDEAVIAAAAAGIARLNDAYPSPGADRFLFLHRRRLWNPAEGCWMGWERKRGKLTELNRLLRGARDTSFLASAAPLPRIPQGVRYVITLDADTRLMRDTVRRLVGKMAHPLNRPLHDPATGRVVAGHAILQPRVTPELPPLGEGSLFQRIFSGPGGIEPYAAAVSDVYQDLFGEGSFTGKGIYAVDAFETALAGRVPDNALLSHDLFEGVLARAAFASDIEVIEDFPARYAVAARRQHRWVRGDWQLLPWLAGARGRDRGGIPALGRWKMFDNLRRSLTAPLTLAALVCGWLMPLPVAFAWTGVVLALFALPRIVGLPLDILPDRAGVTLRSHLAALAADVFNSFMQAGLGFIFLADTAWQMLDAAGRTLFRLAVSRRHLLEWTTTAQSAQAALPSVVGQYRASAGGLALALAASAACTALNPAAWPIVLPAALLWLAAPAVAQIVSRPDRPRATAAPGPADTQALRLIARRTWRYFETFVTADDNFLPPDNFQETPRPAIAHRTSPTNIGLYLLATTAAHDMGWIGLPAAVGRLERTIATMRRMARFRGHLFNWYDTRDLRVLDPAYVSSVDSGNLAGHLIAVAQACAEWQTAPPPPPRTGLTDTILLAEAAALAADPPARPLMRALARFAAAVAAASRLDDAELAPLADAVAAAATGSVPADSDAMFWALAVRSCLLGHLPDPSGGADLPQRLATLARQAREFAMEMEFGFLLDPEKKLLSIGFSTQTNMLDPSCYDFLATEARLASFFAIAKGDIETRHWFRLGRAAVPAGAASVLVSWSGSMFEYLMPALVMRAPPGSVLERTDRLVVARQIAYGRSIGTPWGISESAYNARDLEMTYQYSNFGVPGLGLKRGLGANRVIAPYATGLAVMIDPRAAAANFRRLAGIGAEGRMGFYEALDFTPARLPEGQDVAIVRSYMAHHQGMTITAIVSHLQDGRLRDRFHAEPIVRAAELLLQERVPRDAATLPRRTAFAGPAASEAADPGIVRPFDAPATAPPTAHLLSNGAYSVMLTPTGAGFSNWRGLAVTRWSDDPTQSHLGSFIFLRDAGDGAIWSAAVQPARRDADRHRAVFCEHHAAFIHQGGKLTTRTEVVVSSEDDAEARRVTLTNTGQTPRDIDVTSYAELVLAPPAADLAHPAFSKMFVVTDYLPELGVVIATRRRRGPDEAEIWAAHIAVVEGEETGPVEIETDRARFIGRSRTVGSAAMRDAPLSGTVGTVLDPIFSIRRKVRVPPGGIARVTFWTLVAATSDALLSLVESHIDPSAFERAVTLAWTHSQVQLRHLGLRAADAVDFQRLGGMVVRGDARLRATDAQIAAGLAPRSGLWQLGISGDVPIVLLLIEDPEDSPRVIEALRAHEYLRMHQYPVDLVILNDRKASYVNDLQASIEAAVRSAQTIPRSEGRHGTLLGGIHTLRSDLVSPDAHALLLALASVILIAGRGSIGQQIDALKPPDRTPPRPPLPGPRAQDPVADPRPLTDTSTLEFFNGTGGFADDGQTYVTLLRDGGTTPAPWINVIANEEFGFLVSAEGGGHSWAENSRENQLTPWSNDPVRDPPGEAIYLRDLDSGRTWTVTAQPIRGPGTYLARHGFGHTGFRHVCEGIDAGLVQFVPVGDPVKVSHLTLRNLSGRSRNLSVTAYAEWVLGASRRATRDCIVTSADAGSGTVFATNPASIGFPGRVAFADLGPGTVSLTADRREFLGPDGSLSDPAGLRAAALSGRAGPALDPCAALQRRIVLEPGESIGITFLLGQTRGVDAARALIARTRAAGPDALLAAVREHWSGILSAVQVRSPDRATDILLNGWLLYQTLACRIWARAGFYQASGAYGFRDQLQDGMALAFSRPDVTRAHLLRAAARQFPEGDVQHWWLPHSGQGVRTRISDDRVWLGYAVAEYVESSGDAGVLDAMVPFIEGPALDPGAHDAFYTPDISAASGTLFEHCARGLDQAVALTGANGMPLIGTGDWNDGMNRVGSGGQGTSVWLGWLLIAAIGRMAPLADARGDARGGRWRAHAAALRDAIETRGWDGGWYRRGTYDDGAPLGSAASAACRIDSIAQSWAVLSGAADPDRAATAMAAMTEHLIRPDPGLALLFTPPFDAAAPDPGYVRGYPPGLRENGGQYSHAAMWAILAHARMGDGDAAGGLFALLNPINHARTPEAVARYKVEPYVIAADVYSARQHEGRGGWTWYTGSAGWMYRAGIEGLLGLRKSGDGITLDPCFPGSWPKLEATVVLGTARYAILIENPGATGHGIREAALDGRILPVPQGPLRLPLSDGSHSLRLRLGAPG